MEEENKDKKENSPKKEESFVDPERLQNFVKEASQNTRDIVAYILLLGGLLLLPFRTFVGSVIVGLVFGLYFSGVLVKPLKNVERMLNDLGIVKSIILAALVLALLVLAPGIVIGSIAGVGVRELLIADRKE
jgi:hypothetical protein